jgi:hypothetical protein
MQKPRFMGCFWSLQGKKVPKWHFFDILRAKRNKLLETGAANGNRKTIRKAGGGLWQVIWIMWSMLLTK